MKNSKKILAIALTIILTVLAIGNIIAFAQSNENTVSLRHTQLPEFSGVPVYVLGESSKTDTIRTELEQVTSNIYTITQETLESKLSPERDILAIDGLWLETVSLADVAENLQSVVFEGTPVLILEGSLTLLQMVVEKFQPSMVLLHSTNDASIVIMDLNITVKQERFLV